MDSGRMQFTLTSTGEWRIFEEMSIGRLFIYLKKPWVKISELHACCLLDNCIVEITPTLRFLLVLFRSD